MKPTGVLGILCSTSLLLGCVSEETYLKIQAELDRARKVVAQHNTALERQKSQAAEQKEALSKERNRIADDLSTALAAVTKAQQELERTRTEHEQERERRHTLEAEISKLQKPRELRDENEALRRDRDHLQARLQDLERLLRSSQQLVVTGNKALEEAQARLDAVTAEKQHLLGLKAEYERVERQQQELTRERDQLRVQIDGLQRQSDLAHEEQLQTRKTLEETTARLAAMSQEVAEQNKSLEEARARVAALTAEQQTHSHTQKTLDETTGRLAAADQAQEELTAALTQAQHDLQDRERQLHAMQQDLAATQQTLDEARTRAATLDRDKKQAETQVMETRQRAQELDAKLAAEQAASAGLGQQAAALSAETAKQHEELARLEHQLGQLEAARERAEELAQRLSQRDQEIGRLHQAAADRDALAGRVTALTQNLEDAQKRLADLTADVSATTERAILAEEERDQYSTHVIQQRAALTQAEQDLERLRREREALQALVERQREEDRQATEAEQSRLAREQETREAIARRLTKLREDLSRAFQDEIAQGAARIQQNQDVFTITVLDRVLFEPGYMRLKADGQKLLKRLADVLKPMTEHRMTVEGHTDDIPLGAKLKARYASNWEFSSGKATAIIRFLVEQGGLDLEHIALAGYADMRPIAANDMEEGRALNRRIEIIVAPSDPTVVANQVVPVSHMTPQ